MRKVYWFLIFHWNPEYYFSFEYERKWFIFNEAVILKTHGAHHSAYQRVWSEQQKQKQFTKLKLICYSDKLHPPKICMSFILIYIDCFFCTCGSIHFLSLCCFHFQFFVLIFPSAWHSTAHRSQNGKKTSAKRPALCWKQIVWISLPSRQVNQLSSFFVFCSSFPLVIAIHCHSRCHTHIVTLFAPKSIRSLDCVYAMKNVIILSIE